MSAELRTSSLPQHFSSLIEQRNVWSDWFPHDWISPLSWVQMAAMLMRGTKPESMIDRLAPVLEGTRVTIEASYLELAKKAPADRTILLTYDDYREQFQDELLERYEGFLETLVGDVDLEWLRDRLLRNGAGAQSFIWFLLNGIANAAIEDELDPTSVTTEARWLAELEFCDPAHLAGDEAVLRFFYREFRETFTQAAPLPARPSTYPRVENPIYGDEDQYISRLKAIENRQARQLARELAPTSEPVDLPSDAWMRAMRANPWSQALDLARVPPFHWQRQVAFMLRDVSLDAVSRRIETNLIEMAEATASRALEEAEARGRAVEDIEFGLWFRWWREHFRHWQDPLRLTLERLCRPDDASLVGDWLARFEPAVFADFVIGCAHANTVLQHIATRTCDRESGSERLFIISGDRPLRRCGLHDVTLEVWKCFCRDNGISDRGEFYALDFEVNWEAPLAARQR
ncbi:hypothetical protein [Qipengyuania spongiae]|uniref:Zorya protein ZorC EH domain-containing protein n=1 Tax=Qipengyuania spongiae TaxID=2909673 RepID=A0ABY5T3Q2_9SPHN|nr:hypothetical protein [Qipengyuania spongiae]UVI39921.1 hypothetical protein L1F33_02880 [Qipengyuania spongiae]